MVQTSKQVQRKKLGELDSQLSLATLIAKGQSTNVFRVVSEKYHGHEFQSHPPYYLHVKAPEMYSYTQVLSK